MKYTVTYTDDIPKDFGGVMRPPWFPKYGTCKILIRPKYKNDSGLLAHELKHVEQYSKNWFHNLKYKFSKDYRYKCEFEAYTEQIKAYKYKYANQAYWIVRALLTKYNLDISEKKVIADIEWIVRKLNA